MMKSLLNGELVPVLQTAIGPVILISGVGFLLLTMTNRMSRIIERARELSQEDARNPAARERQVEILWARANLLRWAILFTSMSILSSALLIISLFLAALTRVEMAWFIVCLFITSMCFLICALSLFIKDVNQSLAAVKIELGRK